MTLAMNTMTGRMPLRQFYVLGLIRQIFAVNHMKSNRSHRLQIPTTCKSQNKEFSLFLYWPTTKKLDLGQDRVRRSLFSLILFFFPPIGN